MRESFSVLFTEMSNSPASMEAGKILTFSVPSLCDPCQQCQAVVAEGFLPSLSSSPDR